MDELVQTVFDSIKVIEDAGWRLRQTRGEAPLGEGALWRITMYFRTANNDRRVYEGVGSSAASATAQALESALVEVHA